MAKQLIFDGEVQETIKDGAWRKYEDGVNVRVRPYNQEVSRRLTKDATEHGQFDQKKFDLLFAAYLIADWDLQEVVNKVDGKVVSTRTMPCTAENKLKVMSAWQRFKVWLTNMADTLGEESCKVDAEELGNSSGSPAGKPTDLDQKGAKSAATAA